MDMTIGSIFDMDTQMCDTESTTEYHLMSEGDTRDHEHRYQDWSILVT